jgi:polyisoprenoid-binding protein YceI
MNRPEVSKTPGVNPGIFWRIYFDIKMLHIKKHQLKFLKVKKMAYQIDLAHSQVQFTVRHMMISKVRGTFEKFGGTFEIDENSPADARIEVTIDTSSINTRDEKRDAHLRSLDFFESDKYPQMVFKSSRVELINTEHAKLYGDLTIKGITRPVVLNVEFNGSAKSPWGTTSYGFNAGTTINRKDWNLEWNVALETGGVLVGEEVKIDIELELVKVAEEQAQAAA